MVYFPSSGLLWCKVLPQVYLFLRLFVHIPVSDLRAPQKQGLCHRRLSVLRAQHGVETRTDAGGACGRKRCWARLTPRVEASLKPLALLNLLAPAIQAFFWVLEHTWLVSASALAFPSAGNYLQVFPWKAPLYSLGPSQVDLLRYVFPNTSGQKAPLPSPRQHITSSCFSVTLTRP